jgi:histidyl-tRNA synthetase
MGDRFPEEGFAWQNARDKFRAHCSLYGYGEIETPLCEYQEVFTRGLGTETDIVQKEMFTISHGEKLITLRPEGTAGVARAVVEKGILGNGQVSRWYYGGPMFRAEKPSKGRYRQFHQFGAELYGDPGPVADAEVIDLAFSYLLAMGIPKSLLQVRLNTLGSPETLRGFRQTLVEYYTPLAQDLSPESQRRLRLNPLRILDSKDPRDVRVRSGGPRLMDFITREEEGRFLAVREYLTSWGVPFTPDPDLVRGLDYYTSTVFEIVDYSNTLGVSQDTVAAGGRYDHLVESLGGPKVPAVGFALGVERLLLVAPKVEALKEFSVSVVTIPEKGSPCWKALHVVKALRVAGVVTHMDTRMGSLKSQMRRANDVGSQYVVIIGPEEVRSGKAKVKDMATGEETELGFSYLPSYMKLKKALLTALIERKDSNT